eukprot:scpid24433/ scgid21599/ Retrovirus-related Pol polyprotein from transposon opus; Protease; Reverse transcriptase; Endonuclease
MFRSLSVPSLDFLGYHVNSTGICPLAARVEVIHAFRQPTSIRKLHEFIGMVAFYHRFQHQLTAKLAPLHALLAGRPKKAGPLPWTEDAVTAFNTVKNAFSELVAMHHVNPSAEVRLVTDASDCAVDAVLQQRDAGDRLPIAFFSRKLKPAETRYSTFFP